MRAAVDHLFREGRLLGWGIPATGVLVETLLDRGADGDVAEAEAAIERLAAAPAEDGLVMRDIWLLRLRALLARAHGDDAAYARLPGSLPRHGENAWLRGAYRVGRGDAMTAAAPSGVVTFLFTDVEGSTRRWEADADGMRAALAAHDEVLRTAIEAHGGFMFKHTGDGVCAAFASPRSAVDAAVAAQRALELPVRMGIATGEAELRDGRLLRCGAQSCRAGDGRRARRSDPVGRVDGGSAQRSGSGGSGAAAVAGCADAGRGVSGPSAGPAHGVSAVAGARRESGEPAACDHQLHRARVRGRRGASGGARSSVGDVDRRGWGRQDPAGAGSRGAAGR